MQRAVAAHCVLGTCENAGSVFVRTREEAVSNIGGLLRESGSLSALVESMKPVRRSHWPVTHGTASLGQVSSYEVI